MLTSSAIGRFVTQVCVALLFFTACASAQVLPSGSAPGPNPRIPWLHEGLVFTSSWYAMSHAGHATDFKENEQGNWMAPDGTRLEGSDRPSTSAGGIAQITISCIDGEKVFLLTHSFTDMRLLGHSDPVSSGKPATLVVAAMQCDQWIDPTVLAVLHSDPQANRVVLPLQWTAGDKSFDAVRVTLVSSDHYIDHVYDRATGICLHAAESSTGAAPQLKYLAPGDTALGDTQLSSFNLLSVRDAITPWAAEPLPAWTSQFKVLHYRGETRPSNPFLGPPTPLGLDVSRLDGGNGWVSLAFSGYVLINGLEAYPTKSTFINGRNQYESFFAGPAALAKLKQGQVLDDDPITHITTSVTSVDATSVTITAANRTGGQSAHTFDLQTGKLISSTSIDELTKYQTSFQLQGEE